MAKDLKKLNYKEAWKYFSKDTANQPVKEATEYIVTLRRAQTIDLRKEEQAKERILEVIKPRTLIFVDGASLNGKTTFANRLAKQIEAIVVDVDSVCLEWLNSQLQRCRTRRQTMQVLLNASKASDEYLLNTIESLISKYSKEGKPVILVGGYLEVIYRSIVARTLGSYFNNMVSLFCCELDFHKVENFMKKRANETGILSTKEEILEQYLLSKKRIDTEGGRLLGFGMNYSFVIDSSVSNLFE